MWQLSSVSPKQAIARASPIWFEHTGHAPPRAPTRSSCAATPGLTARYQSVESMFHIRYQQRADPAAAIEEGSRPTHAGIGLDRSDPSPRCAGLVFDHAGRETRRAVQRMVCARTDPMVGFTVGPTSARGCRARGGR